MKKLVILKLGIGNFHQQGFPVTLQIGNDGENHYLQLVSQLPPAPNLPNCYNNWQKAYQQVLQPCLTLCPTDSPVQSYAALKNSLNQWLNSDSFFQIEETLRLNLNSQDEIRFIIETPHIPEHTDIENYLQRIPWHEWNVFEQYPKAEVALSLANYCDPLLNCAMPYHQFMLGKKINYTVKFLGIIGNSHNIQTQADWSNIKKLHQVKATPLEKPKPTELLLKIQDQSGWDILLFTGHSQKLENTAVLHLNNTDSLRVNTLKRSFKLAIKNGLKLAIFNSCDGLELARFLAELNIPQVIVMRDVVPDPVAQDFLKYFMRAFARGNSLYRSVRQARAKLNHKWEKHYPGIASLPVIFQNPATLPITWNQFVGASGQPNYKSYLILLASLLILPFISANIALTPKLTYLLNQLDPKPAVVQEKPNSKDESQGLNLWQPTSSHVPLISDLPGQVPISYPVDSNFPPIEWNFRGMPIRQLFPFDSQKQMLLPIINNSFDSQAELLNLADDYSLLLSEPWMPEERNAFNEINDSITDEAVNDPLQLLGINEAFAVNGLASLTEDQDVAGMAKPMDSEYNFEHKIQLAEQEKKLVAEPSITAGLLALAGLGTISSLVKYLSLCGHFEVEDWANYVWSKLLRHDT